MTPNKVHKGDKLWGLREIGNALGISTRRVRTLAEQPGAPIYKPDGQRYFALRNELVAWHVQWNNQQDLDRVLSKASSKATSSDAKGVRGVKGIPGGYAAVITVNGDYITLGTYDTKEEAAAAYRGASTIARSVRSNARVQ